MCQTFHVANALKTKDNHLNYLIIYCLWCIQQFEHCVAIGLMILAFILFVFYKRNSSVTYVLCSFLVICIGWSLGLQQLVNPGADPGLFVCKSKFSDAQSSFASGECARYLGGWGVCPPGGLEGSDPQEMFYFWTSGTPFAALGEQLQQKINLMKWETIIAIFSLTDSHN
jgi:hypothetical protein